MKKRILAVCVLAVALTACNKAKQDKEAVRQGVIEHVTKNSGLNMADMDVQITALTFHDNEADVTASFQAKGGGSPVQFRYNMEARDGKWVVKGKAMPSGGGMHEAAGPQGPGGGDATAPSAPSVQPAPGTPTNK